MKKQNIFQKVDTWICIHFPILSVRLWWQRLWVREDEFHASLDLDPQIYFRIIKNKEKREKYTKDLVRRRNIAHRKYNNINPEMLPA